MAALQNKHWSWFEEEVNRHYLTFTEKRDINIFIGTWNVNGKEPKESIKSWLFDTDCDCTFNADIYVCGFQEIVDLNNAANLLMENTANQAWEKSIGECLGSQFVQIASRHLVGILLCIYAHKKVRSLITNIMTATVGVGLFGSGGNKGGVGISLQIYDSAICFICSHLAAHKQNVEGRNQDYLKIIENLKFIQEEKAMNNNNESLLSVLPSHDMIFWCGDLNYRLNFDDLEYVLSKVGEKEWRHLLSLDQLNIQRKKQRAFVGFIEAEIDFDPTYKFQPGTSIYEQRPDKKKRFPAWCDRILWRSGLKKTSDISDVTCLKYWLSMEQKQSDHKPVFAHLKYAANIFDNSLRNEMKKEILRNKDKFDNNQLQQLEIATEVSFPFIKFGETEHKKHMMHNAGHSSVHFRFTNATNTSNGLPKWLTISPNYGTIKAKEKIGITFQICITSQNIKDIQSNGYKLQQTVLLRVENNCDSDTEMAMKSIAISAKYLISCFGNKIENLIKYKKPIRFIDDIYDIDINKKQIKKQIVKYDEHNGEGDIDDNEFLSCIETNLCIPKELWRLVDHLYRYGMDCESIFISRGINTEINLIRECLDTGKPFTRYNLLSVGEALIRFLESLQDPIFPYSLCQSLNAKNENIDITQWCRQALITLPLSHYNAFIYVVSFLRDILSHCQSNRLTADKLAYQFTSALMQVSIKDVNELDTFQPFKILRHFLSKDLFL